MMQLVCCQESEFKVKKMLRGWKAQRRAEQSMEFNSTDAGNLNIDNNPSKKIGDPFVRSDKKIGRNEPCPCESGKKYKQCHGRLN